MIQKMKFWKRKKKQTKPKKVRWKKRMTFQELEAVMRQRWEEMTKDFEKSKRRGSHSSSSKHT